SHLLTNVAPQAEKYVERDVLALQKLNVFCLADDTDWQARSAWWQNCVSTVTYLYTTLNRYSADAASQYPALVQKIRNEIASLQQAVAQGDPWQSTWSLSAQERVAARACGLETICDQLRQLGQMSPDTPPAPAAKPPAMTPDAFRNPVYIRYALKTLLACMICYTFYSGVDWEGIHTCMLTCIIVANPGIGSSYQKMLLRFGGALCGALLALLVAIFAMPWLDNIAELLCLLAPVFLLGAWIATGSERSSYIGTQMVVTFALATLENVFGPVYDLVEIRDRAMGILIGIAVSAVIYTFIWPESEADALPQKLAGALGILGKLLRIPRQPDPRSQRTYLQLRIGCHAAFNACEEMRERVALEYQLSAKERACLLADSLAVIDLGREMLYRWDTTWNSATPSDHDLRQTHAERIAQALEHYAAGLASRTSRSPALALTVSPTLPEQEQSIAHLISCLPDWTAPEHTPVENPQQGTPPL
ncbi:multidrug transporter subunit MdtO, partial [Salmonella enterica]|nr:multidrug transporter subunit MdtO [Salmonella enterica]